MIHERKNQGARNVNWVGGDPTPNLLYILEALKNSDVNIPQIWNSNMYCSKETIKLLNGVIDLYLTDFKYGNNECAKRLSKVDNYMDIIKRNHKIVEKNGEMIIRHLVMPNHIECCSKSILQWIADNIPKTPVNIMGQYHPDYFAKNYQDISRSISSEEIRYVEDIAKKLQIIRL
jgi:putative pyruvate formate lyase activating enzyme